MPRTPRRYSKTFKPRQKKQLQSRGIFFTLIIFATCTGAVWLLSRFVGITGMPLPLYSRVLTDETARDYFWQGDTEALRGRLEQISINDAVASQQSSIATASAGFEQWYALAREAGVVTGSKRENGIEYVISPTGKVAPYSDVAAAFPPQELINLIRLKHQNSFRTN